MPNPTSRVASPRGLTAKVRHGRYAGRTGTVLGRDAEAGTVTLRIAFGARTAVIVIHRDELR